MPTPFNQDTHAIRRFTPAVLKWFAKHGRHDLPWQQLHKTDKDIYAVWLSEIMLQQTQVATVLGYFERFMQAFPTVQDLAVADWEAVANLWAGLGYYARARNLHAGAQQVAQFIRTHGKFPQMPDEWQAIKGVGRSTAGAIVAMGVGGRGVICDGNVKRVLTRWAGIDGDITKSATDKALWQLADTLTPARQSGEFAQAMMDLGATLCTRTRPKCEICPIAADCIAHRQGKQAAYPVKAKKSVKPTHHSQVLLITHGDLTDNDAKILWLKRPDDGIWGGLWCPPLLSITRQDTFNDGVIGEWLSDNLHSDLQRQNPPLAAIKHTLTHFHWQLSARHIALSADKFTQLKTLLADIHAEHHWQPLVNTLAKPAAMDKLLNAIA
ncbi:A/G-specific adenine glycosylase [Moraxella caviae]|uniref:Adenine DNA glycosylase n=1 Tax=Moraxella caviae TaxID=34060 RepID=A0A1T0A0L0_9GAMM|nr:A/G-specific adenine glycosylase [Moraxella caviae]